ncbi:MAG: carbamoyl-phosphate synthase (glutamine-hydrolyzing) large subunit [Thermococcus sp.]|uniref:carbamoyl-phosphate synthase (glutamine-hydrolyzing) large subunit n=1 Tax=Thermococcus sp. TaxID=35749 RepID=UPI002609AF11|nr:carbamoyl-phosphate synthase (glutamine-hydrolyzing) large subunit [Thermococcus sp.]MCD6139580.1 carbamoyl-phosphate synthase (glutamine-hydrolyzing) large subunit [Thermococcus sp.]
MRLMVSKVLILGSGAIKIGEAAEFDYSGSQALKALKEEGIETILINPNVATIQTSHEIADKVYLLPLDIKFVEEVIKKEKPDGILLGFGGQSALSLGVALHDSGILEKYNIKVLGTPIEGIKKALDREKFRETMIKNNLPIPPSKAAKSVEEALKVAQEIGFPVMVRVSFNLGGRGSFVAWNEEEFEGYIVRAFAQSEIGEVLVEKYLKGWKEIEFEVVRDKDGNAVAVACLENFDPMGVHTGDSIVVAPSQTLTNREYQLLRSAAIEVAEAIDLIGECNVQLALDPKSEEFYIIETNPRMSRSSALASKVTGYPLAYIAAKLALDYTLDELLNGVTGVTTALFEPSLDYVVVKMPRWDLEKFENAKKKINTEMKSIGEVMAIGRNLHEAFQKAIRMVGMELIGKYYESEESLEKVMERIKNYEPYMPMHIAKALKLGASVNEIHEITGIDKFYLYIIEDLVKIAEALRNPNEETIREAKKLGFSDEQIKALSNGSIKKSIPFVKQIDTLAGEVPARTNYLYMTYDAQENDIPYTEKPKVLILGAGVFRIGVSVEFDWAVVNFANAAKKRGYEVIVLNYNPETVSTDWDINDKLYLEEITLERVLDIYNFENPDGVIAFAGGQLANSLAKKLEQKGVRLLGTRGTSVDIAEDRVKFSKLLEKLNIKQPAWIEAKSVGEVLAFADEVGYPLMIRPSYVLSGTAMKVAYNEKELKEYLSLATKVSPEHPVVVSKFLDAMEAEIDAVSDGKRVVGVTLEHIEKAGVHSGDATMITPYRYLKEKHVKKMHKIALELALALGIRGPFNIQFLVNDDVYVLELNLRTSRSMPFSSKSRGVNLMELSAQAVFDGKLSLGSDYEYYEIPAKAFAVKSPQFSWSQLQNAYPFLGPEMRSTGEVASLGFEFEDALLKSWLSVKPNKMPKSNILVYGYNKDVPTLLETAKLLETLGYNVFTLEDSLNYGNALSKEKAINLMKLGEIKLVMTSGYAKEKDYFIRRTAVDLNVPIVLDANLGYEVSKAFAWAKNNCFEVKELSEYYAPKLQKTISEPLEELV